MYRIITSFITIHYVSSTSAVPIVTVVFKAVVLKDYCFVFLTPIVIMLRPWERHNDEDVMLV